MCVAIPWVHLYCRLTCFIFRIFRVNKKYYGLFRSLDPIFFPFCLIASSTLPTSEPPIFLSPVHCSLSHLQPPFHQSVLPTFLFPFSFSYFHQFSVITSRSAHPGPPCLPFCVSFHPTSLLIYRIFLTFFSCLPSPNFPFFPHSFHAPFLRISLSPFPQHQAYSVNSSQSGHL